MRAGGFVVATILGLVSAPIVTRHLGIVDFGRHHYHVDRNRGVTVTDAGVVA